MFVQNLVVQRHVPHGLQILRGRVLRTITASGIQDRIVSDADAFAQILKDVFALDMPEAGGLWPKLVARHEDVMAQKAAGT